MDSITKTKLNEEQINSLVKKAFGEKVNSKSVKEFEEGWFNAVYLINLDDGKEVILKVSPSPKVKVLSYEKGIMSAEVEVMRLLANLGTVPVPRVYYYDDSAEIIENEYFFMEKIDGKPFDKVKWTISDEQREKIEKELGYYNRLINNIKGENFGFYPQKDKGYSKWSEGFYNMFKSVLEDGKVAEVKLPLGYDEIEELFIERLSLLDYITEPSLVHWDLHDGNLFVNEEGKITGIFDFERVMWADPLMEVYFGNFFDHSNFCKGYGESAIDTEEGKILRVMYNIYLDLIMVIESKYRGVSDEGHLKWTYEELEKELQKFKAMK